MRFTDPLSTLWHMGGSIPTHLGMALYSNAVHEIICRRLHHLAEDCAAIYPKFEVADI